MPEATTPDASATEPVLFKKPRKKAPTKAEALLAFSQLVHDEEVLRGTAYLQEFLQRPTFDRASMVSHYSNSEFPASVEFLYQSWQAHRDAGFPKDTVDPLQLVAGAWEAAQGDPSFLEVLGEHLEEHRYLVWLFDDPDTQGLIGRIPKGWADWIPGCSLDAQPVLKAKAARAKKSADAGEAALKAPRVKKEPKPKEPKDLRSVFLKRLETLTPESLFRPWMATKALRLITDPADLQSWADKVLADKSRWRPCPVTGELMPVVAVDTENAGANGGASGLDTRMVNGVSQLDNAGICLSADGVEGLYVPISHEDGHNCPREDATRILQYLFDRSLTVYFNAKYDREVLRNSLGMTLRPYPYFEDVQILQFLLDPKSEEEEEVSSFESAGLKALARKYLDCEMLELGALAKVRARYVNPVTGKVSERQILAPFNWLPTHLALPYAAGDGIFTWLLWEKLHEEARKMKFVHKVDHRLADALAWVERQRPIIDTKKHEVLCRWHAEKMHVLKAELADLSGIDGFNPGSTPQLSRVLFGTFGFPVIKSSEKTGKPSTDADVIEELMKAHPGHPFLSALVHYREYSALHPDHLRYDPRDHTARLYFKQCTVAGGRLAAMGGTFEKDGGFGLNPQAIVAVGGNKWVTLRRLRLEDTADLGEGFDPESVPELALDDVHPSCLKKGKEKVKVPNPEYIQPPPLPAPKGDMDDWRDAAGLEREAQRLREIEAHQAGVMAMASIPEFLEETREVTKLDVPRVVKGRIARYCGEWWSLAKDEDSITLASGEVVALDPPSEVDANEVVNLRGLFVAPKGYSFFVVDYCLVPGSRVLTSDLRWVPVETVSEGDELIGFDETLPEKFCPNRKLRATRVTAREVFSRPCVRITTDRGVVTCSVEHQWLTRVRKGGAWNARGDARGQYGWRESQHLKVGDEIARLCDPWEEEVSPEAGYLAGVFDGEGWVSSQTVGFGQKEGYVLDKVEGLLRVRGYDVRRSTSGSKVTMLRLNGGRQETLRFLGSVRPGRLITNARSKMWEGLSYRSRYTQAAKVLAIEEVGEQEVIALRTTERTFIAEGMLSHNCNIEMRVAANVSREPKFIEEFMTGSGDFHTLTAKSVFPEFSKLQAKIKDLQAQDPRGLDSAIQAQIKVAKAKMKKLRSLAKIINFALLYGGTEHAIFEGMKAEDPTITKDKAAAMVATYWDSVPFFKDWAQTQMARARETFMCKTATGRRIDFKSAMRSQKITEPLPEHWTNYRAFWDLKRRAEDALKAGKREQAATLEARAQELRRDKSTGVANLGDYKKFVSKIQRVSTNAPLQGLAGDFMRCALGHIHCWAVDAGLGDILLLHATVHDEIDFSVKNEYVPYVLPRIIRLMKLREMHAAMNWPVPIECDCEYGSSWDVKEHLTGDDTHNPAGWTKIPGLESYVPAMFDPDTVAGLREALASQDAEVRQAACDYLRSVTHPRCHVNIPKLEGMPPQKASLALTAILQLHEYWLLDEAGDAGDETLEEYQIRMGLVPGELVVRPQVAVPEQSLPEPKVEEPMPQEAPEPSAPELPDTPPAGSVRRPKIVQGYPVLKDLKSEAEQQHLREVLGAGRSVVAVRTNSGVLLKIPGVRLTEIPEEFLVLEDVVEEA